MASRFVKSHCRSKVGFATREFAEQVVAEAQHREHPARWATLRPYLCFCGSWHTGHSDPQRRQPGSNSTTDALGRLRELRAVLIADYGRTKNPKIWQGVRALSGAIRFLQG